MLDTADIVREAMLRQLRIQTPNWGLLRVFVASFMSLKPRAFFKVSDEDRKLVEVKFQGAAGT